MIKKEIEEEYINNDGPNTISTHHRLQTLSMLNYSNITEVKISYAYEM